MKTINTTEADTLMELADVLEGYDRNFLEGDEFDEDGNETDAYIIHRTLPILQKILSREDSNRAPDLTITKEMVDNATNLAFRRGRESVYPNFKYCIYSHNICGKLYLTDDIGKAMKKAAELAIYGERYNIYRIVKVNAPDTDEHNTYKLILDGFWKRGGYHDPDAYEYFLHYDYIAQTANEIVKL